MHVVQISTGENVADALARISAATLRVNASVAPISAALQEGVLLSPVRVNDEADFHMELPSLPALVT